MIKGVIFDVDGVLLDSMKYWMGIAETYLNKMGIQPETNLNEKMLSLSLVEGAEYLVEHYPVKQTVKEILDEIMELMQQLYDKEIPLKPGVRELIQYFEEKKIPMAVATAGHEQHVINALQRLGVLHSFQRILTCTELGVSKRTPDIYLAASEILGTTAEETLVFEDTYFAAGAAKSAGFPVFGVYDETSKADKENMQELCDDYIEDFRECIARIGELV
ncbi:MAG: HAD family hydrolase [Lachnospiraceae bacterium]